MLPVNFTPAQVHPKRNVVLVKLDDAVTETPGGIQIPDSARDRQKVEHKVGRVLAVGPGKFRRDNGDPLYAVAVDPGSPPSPHCINLGGGQFILTEPLLVNVGDRVLFDPPYAATVPGYKDYFLLEDDAILATIEESAA